jgi:hypothetical protein
MTHAYRQADLSKDVCAAVFSAIDNLLAVMDELPKDSRTWNRLDQIRGHLIWATDDALTEED